MTKTERKVWFAASLRNGQWKRCSSCLDELGIGYYIPPSYNTLLFFNTAKSRALSLVNSGKLNARFFIDHSTHTLLEVPDKQMDDFIKVSQNHDCVECVPPGVLKKGDKVVVTRGPLSGVEGEIAEADDGTSFLVVRVLSLLCAKTTISRKNVRLIGV
jgi:hypothetical protein